MVACTAADSRDKKPVGKQPIDLRMADLEMSLLEKAAAEKRDRVLRRQSSIRFAASLVLIQAIRRRMRAGEISVVSFRHLTRSWMQRE